VKIGIDIEQFTQDPYATGIQRVLQYLAREWPSDVIEAEFVVPISDRFGLLTKEQAAEVLDLPFGANEPDADLRSAVAELLHGWHLSREIRTVPLGELVSLYDRWLLPEVSYLPSVLERMEIFRSCMPATMIAYDALPMTDPANYRFKPGGAAYVSEYFRLLAAADAVVCISEFTMQTLLTRLRRDPTLPIVVAHPGGDHLPIRTARTPAIPRFLRVGTLEERKMPLEILHGFMQARDAGMQAELVFVGNPSASNSAINARVTEATKSNSSVQWIRDATDAEVHDLMNTSSVFLSFGIEGYGIPVLEAIRQGTPVLFAGIQPAGELMEGRGATRTTGVSVDEIAEAFTIAASGVWLEGQRSALSPETVPTWSDFATTVAQSAVAAP